MIGQHHASCVNCGKRVEWIVLGINFGLFLLKGWFALICHSESLFIDSLESLANFLITIVVLVCLNIASRRADEKFPYGYGKVEFLASGIVNMLLMIAVIIYIIMSLSEMAMVGPEKPPGLMAIFAAVVSICVNYIAFGYGRCVGEKIGSSAILANAQISLSDIGTSLAVIVAVVGSNLGFSKFDHIVAILISIVIIEATLNGTKKAIKGLMDNSLDNEERHIRNLLEGIENCGHIGDVHARLSGRDLLVDIDLFIPSDWVLSRGLETVQKIKNVLSEEIEDISEVSVRLPALPVADNPVHKTDYPLEKSKSD